jgi:murein L,D-transpeptidase YcbB/YkuD
LGLLVLVAVAAGCGQRRIADTESPSPAQLALRGALSSGARPSFVTRDNEGKRLWKLTRDFYERRTYTLAWIDDRHPTSHMDGLIEALRAADAEGLDPDMYSLSTLVARREEATRGFLLKKGFEPERVGDLELFLTYLYMKYASDLADGMSDLAHADASWHIEPEPFDPLDHLERALANNEVSESLRSLSPEAAHYKQLRDALAEYREQAAAGGWPRVPKNLRARPGERSESVAQAARRLAASRDLQGKVPDTGALLYDDRVGEAVKRFQRRHGLADDGIVGPAVAAAMNVPIEHRIEQIRLNLERWRWLPRELGDPHILVNIPAYSLEVWERDQVALSMRVVVGKKDTPTPIFNDRMTYIVFSPYWNVPSGIAEGETLPAVLTDPTFLERNNMEVLDASGNPVDPSTIDLDDPAQYRFRQRPGRGNSLGLVKFMFPNQFNVYLHDTPADSLFARATRSFSHGCVRVEQPQALAERLLRNRPEWTPERIADAMHAGTETTLKLEQPIPVYLGYWTALATPGGVQFSGDVYGIDQRQRQLLEARMTRLKKTLQTAPAARPRQTG